jgi:hypothetical protein
MYDIRMASPQNMNCEDRSRPSKAEKAKTQTVRLLHRLAFSGKKRNWAENGTKKYG